MQRFRDVSDATIRKIDRKMMSLDGLATLNELEARFLNEAAAILPADCMCWNNWKPDLSFLMNFKLNESYHKPFENLLGIFNEVVAHHPVIAAGHFETASEGVKRMSDFECSSRFRENPLFREVYRHLDSNYQLAYMPCVLQDRRILLTWNRRALDFTERDREIFHLLGLRLGVISRRIEQRERLEKSWQSLCEFVDARTTAGPAKSLGAQDVRLLELLLKSGTRSGIAREFGIRRDSVDKRLGTIRERLGLENHHQLLSALADLGNIHRDPALPVRQTPDPANTRSLTD
jgi:DNA-binding CsgD family transcriptional regulator